MTKGPEIVNIPPGAEIHANFVFSETVWMHVNGTSVPEPSDRGYNPDAFVVLRDSEAGDDTSN